MASMSLGAWASGLCGGMVGSILMVVMGFCDCGKVWEDDGRWICYVLYCKEFEKLWSLVCRTGKISVFG
jgi:hypothetical protein